MRAITGLLQEKSGLRTFVQQSGESSLEGLSDDFSLHGVLGFNGGRRGGLGICIPGDPGILLLK